jgi:hypothetical protein
MKRIGVLIAGGDTPALNATIHGAVVRANQLKVEIVGLIKGFIASSTVSMPRNSRRRRWRCWRKAETTPFQFSNTVPPGDLIWKVSMRTVSATAGD